MSPELYANDKNVHNSGMNSESHGFKGVIDDGEPQHIQPHRRHHQIQQQHHRHVHFNKYDVSEVERRQEQQQQLCDDAFQLPRQNLEVSCEHNPTKLFLLMNQQVWSSAMVQLHQNPIEAHTWISSFFPNSDECKWRNLPLHLACLHGPEPVPLQFMEALIEVYPSAAQCHNYEGNLPIHLACECMDFGPRFEMEVEGILITLIKVFPDCLSIRDSRGRRPIDILDEKGVRSDSRTTNKGKPLGRVVGILKYMRSHERRFKSEQRRGMDERKGNTGVYRNHVKAKLGSRRPEHIQVPDSSRDDTMVHGGQANTTPQNGLIRQNPSTNEQSFPSFPNIDIFESDSPIDQTSGGDSPCDPGMVTNPNPQQPIMVQSLVSPAHSVATISSHNINACQSPIGHVDPFHHLVAEMSTMRHAHHSMSVLLSTKVQNENELKGRLSKLEEEYEQLKNDFDDLAIENSAKGKELEEKTAALKNSNYALKIIRSKEIALSDELALKLEVEGTQCSEIKTLQNELDVERKGRLTAEEKLEGQMKMRAEWEQTSGTTKSQNERISRENNQLSMEVKEMHAQLAQKNTQLQDYKGKEATLLGLLSKMHSVDALEEKLDKSSDENERLTDEKEKISKENSILNKQLLEMNEKESKMKMLMGKVKDTLEMSQKEKQRLEMQVVMHGRESHETKMEQAKLVRELSEKRTMLREVNDALQQSRNENEELQIRIFEKEKRLQDTMTKDTNLEGELVEKKKLLEEVNDTLGRSQHENKQLRIQVAGQGKLLKETITKEEGMVAELLTKDKSLTKMKDMLGLSQNENKNLQIQIARQKKQMQEASEKEETLMEELLEKSQLLGRVEENDISELGELPVKNRALREVALKAIDIMQQQFQVRPASNYTANGTLEQLLKAAELVSIGGDARSENSSALHTGESIELLRPIINYARNLQQDTTERIQQLLQQSRDTMEIIEQISSISHESSPFGPTLQILEDTITTYVQVMESLGATFDINERSKTRLASILNRRPLGEIDNALPPKKYTKANPEAPEIATISLVKDHSTKIASITQKHLEKLENLSKTVGRLPQMKKIDLDLDKTNVRQHLNMVDEITTVLHRALSNLTQDARQLMLANESIHMVCTQ
mmetsp:Transcript_137/g.335  ORF Transcript_137/g.335 Transcript_137/m.335 type:complete len:1127 (+) Transcript_137:243-3623(+)